MEPLISFIHSADTLLIQIPILLKHISQEHMSLYSTPSSPMPTDTDTNIGNSNEYTQDHFQYPYIVMLPDSYVPLIKPQFNLCTCMGVLYYCENTHLLWHRSWYIFASTIILSGGFSNQTYALHSQTCNYPEPDSTIIDARDLILPLYLPRPWTLVFLLENRSFLLEYSTYRVNNRREFC